MVMEKSASGHRRQDSAGSDKEWGGSKRETFESFGWVFHLGVNSIGKEYSHLRFLFIRGNYVEMYKRDPNENPGIKPIRRGIIGPSLMVEEIGHKKVNHRDVYALRFYNRLDERKKGEIACATAEEAQKWIEAFDHAKQQAEMELTRSGSARYKLTPETEIDLGGRRPKMRRIAKKLIRIGHGPETLMKQPSSWNDGQEGYFGGDSGDAIECHDWRCIRTINGIRIFEDAADAKNARGVLVKSVAVVDASAETVFNVILNLEKHRRHEWDTFADNLELIDTYEGHYDVVYGTIHPKYLSSRWQSKRDFVISRQWFHAQDGTYTILLRPAVHKSKPPRSGYRRTNVNSSTWEIISINTPMGSNTAKSLVTQVLETQTDGWSRWKNSSCSKFEKTVPYALLSQVSGLKEYVEANPSLKSESSTNTESSVSSMNVDFTDVSSSDQFYDALDGDSSSSSDEELGDEEQHDENYQDDELGVKNVSGAIAGLNIKKNSATDAHRELDPDADAIDIDLSKFNGSLPEGKDEADSNCWTSPCGTEFMIRGKNYLKDNSKIVGREPLLKLIAVDWLKVDERVDNIALHPKCLVQSEAGKELPFIFIINLQIPAKPNYSLVSYYAADRPLAKDSLLAKFADGTDAFRDSKFKLIPSIVQGYWMVKRAVGTKACMLGKAVTCRYLRQDNFLEIDVDIGSSSVARNVIGLVLGYVTSLVVDLAILVEAKEEEELPEYILGSVRLNRINPNSAVHFEV